MKAPYPRKRENTQMFPTEVTSVTVDNVLPAAPLYYTYPGVESGLSDVMMDVVTPGFHTLKLQGAIINTANYKRSWSRVYSSGTVTDTEVAPEPDRHVITYHGNYTAGQDMWGVHSPGADLVLKDLIDTQMVTHEAAMRARNRVSPPLVQSLVSVAESKKTLRMVSRALDDLAIFARAAIRGTRADFKRAAKAMRQRKSPFSKTSEMKYWGGAKEFSADSLTIARRWLEMRYGWTPAVMDVMGIVRAIDNHRSERQKSSERQVARGFSLHRKTLTTHGSNDVGNSGVDHYTCLHTNSVGARAYVLYVADLTFQSARDFGVLELPRAIHEIIPYSFVFDWVYQVGDWIGAITPKAGIKTVAEGVTTTIVRHNRRTLTSNIPNTLFDLRYQRTGHIGMSDSIQEIIKYRDPHFDVLYSPPYYNVKLNVKRVLDAFALFRGRTAGLKLGRGFD